jgi:hypothetical protein
MLNCRLEASDGREGTAAVYGGRSLASPRLPTDYLCTENIISGDRRWLKLAHLGHSLARSARGQPADLVAQLWQIGIDDVFVAGSFVEEKDHPNDVDGYFACDVRYYASGQLEQALNALDPHSIWTWDNARRRPAPGKAFPQLPMWHQYRVELYPDYGQAFGRLPGGALVMARDWFRRTRDLRRKGIVQIVREVPE